MYIYYLILIFSLTLNSTEFTLSPNTKLIIEHKNITHSNAKVIVNSANQALSGDASGISNAIFRAAGWSQLQQACNQYPLFNDARCPMGNAIITDSFNLKKQGILYIIHAVGPDCRYIKGITKQNQLLHDAYYNSLAIADESKLDTIAFSFIGVGVFSCSKDRAAKIALETVLEYIRNNKNSQIKIIYFDLYFERDYELFEKLAKNINQ